MRRSNENGAVTTDGEPPRSIQDGIRRAPSVAVRAAGREVLSCEAIDASVRRDAPDRLAIVGDVDAAIWSDGDRDRSDARLQCRAAVARARIDVPIPCDRMDDPVRTDRRHAIPLCDIERPV